MALCSLSTGSTCAPLACMASWNTCARRHHAFLVGQRHHHAAADGGQRRLDRGRAHDGDHDEIGRRAAASITAWRPPATSMPVPGKADFNCAQLGVVADHRQLRLHRLGLLDQHFDIVAGGQRLDGHGARRRAACAHGRSHPAC